MILQQPEFRDTGDTFRVRVIWVAFALSMLFHAAMMWRWPVSQPPDKQAAPTDQRGRMQARLAPARSPDAARPRASLPQAVPAPPTLTEPPAQARARKPEPKPAPPPVVALNRPAPAPATRLPEPAPPTPPALPTPPAPIVPFPAPPASAPGGDFASMLEARRRARGESALATSDSSQPSPVVTDHTRSDRVIAANLGTLRAPTLGENANNSGGIFQIRRLGLAEAEFAFFGWNKEMGRRTPQMIEVRKGDHGDIRIAVVRRMISIIREHEKGDFVWESRRLGRTLTLSARASDNAGLEEFLLHEFFG